jgi:HSP20 family protein
MANLIRRNQGSRDVATPTSAALMDPFRLMREVFRWDPFRELQATLATERAFAPSIEVQETGSAYIFRLDLPGVREEDLDISLTGNRLAIGGHREQTRESDDDQYYATEISYGSFTRAFTLPDGVDVDNVKAEMQSGVLTLVVPKRPEVQPRSVPIGQGQQAQGSAKAERQEQKEKQEQKGEPKGGSAPAEKAKPSS